ncbi:MAG TPA: proton-conducting transporter membrane subunit [Bacillota bacterium]|nr:proton-conducting transporter membrane subunit [Bacillota bacterium]
MNAAAEIYSLVPAIIVLLPIIGAIACYLVGLRWPAVRDWLSVVTAGATAALSFTLFPAIQEGAVIVGSVPILMPLGLTFRLDALGFLLTSLTAVIWLLATLYSLTYMKGEHGVNRYYAFLLVTLSGAAGTFMAGDLFSFFLFFELMSLPAAVLVIHEETPAAVQAALKYLFMTVAGSLMFFFSMVATFEMAGSVALGGRGLIPEASPIAFLTFAGFVIALGMKAGMVPLHMWLPDAHPVAPSPASALLSGIMIKTGAYGLLRVMYEVFGLEFLQATGWNNVVLVLSVVTILLGSAVAVTQYDLKRRLAYSSIGQMGCILLGMGLMSERALTGDVFYFFADAVAKSCLFLCAGVILKTTGKRDIRQFAGLGQRLPVTMVCFTLAALTLMGIPPLNGFVSKWQLSVGAFDAGMPGYALALLASSMLNAVYYLPIVMTAFFDHPAPAGVAVGAAPLAGGEERARPRQPEASATMLVPMLILALGCAVFALSPGNWPLRLSEAAARVLFSK